MPCDHVPPNYQCEGVIAHLEETNTIRPLPSLPYYPSPSIALAWTSCANCWRWKDGYTRMQQRLQGSTLWAKGSVANHKSGRKADRREPGTPSCSACALWERIPLGPRLSRLVRWWRWGRGPGSQRAACMPDTPQLGWVACRLRRTTAHGPSSPCRPAGCLPRQRPTGASPDFTGHGIACNPRRRSCQHSQ